MFVRTLVQCKESKSRHSAHRNPAHPPLYQIRFLRVRSEQIRRGIAPAGTCCADTFDSRGTTLTIVTRNVTREGEGVVSELKVVSLVENFI